MSQPTASSPSSGQRATILIILVILILVPFGYSVVSYMTVQAEPTEVFLEMPDPVHKECVKDTEYMRYHHWELLRNVREEVVRYGIRGEVSLDGCRDCHTSREEFCNKCHDATSLKPDCFGCHYYP